MLIRHMHFQHAHQGLDYMSSSVEIHCSEVALVTWEHRKYLHNMP